MSAFDMATVATGVAAIEAFHERGIFRETKTRHACEERVAAQFALADLPLRTFLEDHLISYESDEITRLIANMHNAKAFAAISHLTVAGFRDWLLSDDATQNVLGGVAPGVTPEMAAAVSKICCAQDLLLIAAKCIVITRFRNTVGLPGAHHHDAQLDAPANTPCRPPA